MTSLKGRRGFKRVARAGLLPVRFGQARKGQHMRRRLMGAAALAQRLEADLRLSLDLARGCEQVLRLWLHCGSPSCLRARGCAHELACLCLLQEDLRWFAPEFAALHSQAEAKWKANLQCLSRSGAMSVNVDDFSA